MSNPHSRSEQDCMKMCLKNGVPHNGTLVWGTPFLRCRMYRNYAAGCIGSRGFLSFFWGIPNTY